MVRGSRSLPVVLVAVAGVLSACGSGSSATTAAPASAGSSTTSAASSAPATPAATTAAAGGDFCATVRTNVKVVTGQQMSSLLTGGTAQAWKTYLAAAAKANADLVAAAPADIRPTVQTLQKDSDEIGTILAAAGYDTSKVKTTDLLKAVSSPEHTAASKAFVGYVKTSCGIDLSKLPS